ncbi:WD40-repeat-containing domain [Phytophthora cactorum]|nr:WD40-repeat-containing domain [Phytophthora cactorum]
MAHHRFTLAYRDFDLDQNGAVRNLTLGFCSDDELIHAMFFGSLPGAETRLSTQLHHLACATLDGHVVTWRVSLNASTASCDCVKTSEVELRDVFRQFDTVNGVHELKFHPQQDVMTAACRDGTIFFFDVAPLLDSNKPYVLVVSEIGVKGRYSGKDNVPLSSLSLRALFAYWFVVQMPAKRLKMASLTSSVRNPGELCCLTSYGLLVLKTSFLAAPTPIFIPRGSSNTPAIGFPSSMAVRVEFLAKIHKTNHKSTLYRTEPKLRLPPRSSALAFLCYSTAPGKMDSCSNSTDWWTSRGDKPQFPLFSLTTITNASTSFPCGRASAANATDEPDARQQRAAARSLTLTIYKISGDDAEIEFVETSFASGEDNVLHVFSGPLLGIVKYVADVNVPDPAPLVAGGAIVKRARDSPASLSRVQRAQSFMLGLSAMSSPKMTDLRLTMMSPSQSPSASPTAASFESIDSASDLTKTFLEFYEWSPVTGSSTNDQSKQFEGDSTSTMTLLHEIPTPSPALSLHWVHHTLFFTTEDEVKCSLISRTRCFTLALASRWVLNEASCATQVSDDDLNQFPRPQVRQCAGSKACVGGPLQAVHILDLSNRVLQCAVLVTAESVERAAELAQPLCPDATEWLGAVFEAFDHASEALRFLPGLSLSLKVNMCIKHALLEPLAKLLGDLIDHERDSPNLTMEAPLTQLGTALLSRKRHNDAIFVASLLRNDEVSPTLGAAFHAAKAKTSATMPTPAAILNKWNASVAKPTAAWRTVLERQGIRPPTMVKLQAAGHTLEELDVSTGALLCHITFDLLASSNVDFILPAGPHFVVGLLQSRLLIVWDLDESVLLLVKSSVKVLFVEVQWSPWHTQPSTIYSVLDAMMVLFKSGVFRRTKWTLVSLKGPGNNGFCYPLFAVQLAQSPVVEICIGMCTGCGTNGSSSNMFLAAAYQNRRADVIAMNGQAHTCVASTMLAPPQTSDFSRLGGALTLAIHAQLPVLLMHWRSHRSDLGVDVIAAWELVNTGGSSVTSPRGGAGGNSSGGGAMTNWWPVANSSTLNMSMGRRQVLATDIVLWQNSLAVYASTIDRRSIFLIDIQPNQTSTNATEMEPKTVLALSTMTQLTLAQYHDYPTGIPTSQLQIAVKTSAKGTPVLKLQRFSQVSGGLTGSSDQLLDWKSERGVPLLPFQVLASRHHNDDVIVNPDDDDGVIAASSLPAIELKYGSLQHEARDVCFSMNSSVDSGDASKSQSYLLLVLSKTGDAITFQTTRDPSNERVKLNQPVERVFATPHLLPATSPYQSAVVCKLLYLLEPGLQSERLVLSGDDLSVPVESSPSWMCEANERIVDVQWNSSTCPQIGPHDSQQRLLLAVTTTQRIVVLSPELRQLRAYDFKNDLMGVPESLLWVSQTLLYSTTGNQVRFVTPVADHLQNDTSRLLCSIADLDTRSGFTQSSIQLVSMCGDRLCYAVSNAVTLSSRLTLHSVALCEPLLLGFAVPNATLRRLFEREMVAFTLMNDDSDRPVCSISDAVLETAYHTFGWKDKVLKVLKALINSHEKSSSAVAADGGAVVAPSSNYSRTSLLSRTIMGSIFLDAHKWEDFLRVFLAHDPALEEYVIAIDSDGAAKLPSRMGPTARRFRQLAAVFESIGQPDWAMRCLDLSGDDEALLTMFRKFNTASASSEVIDTLQKTWTKLNPPLSAITKAAMTQQDHSMIRSRYSVARPPEDASEWLGVSTKARIATTEPRALNYSLFATEASAISGSLLNVDAISTPAAFSPTPGASAEAASAKMTIGPFQDEEDAVVAYWRFEEGATASSEPSQDGIECLDTSKRENTLRLFGAVNLVESSAPVDRGEPGRIPEEFALRFPSSTSSLPSSGWGAQCPIRPGSTLDIATTFDEDPYRREFTFEVWVRNYKMCDQIQKIVENGDGIPATLSSGARQVLVSRKRVESLDDGVKGEDVAGLASWELVIDEDDHLVLTFGNQQVRSTQKMEHSGNLGWRHVAFTMDVSSPQRVGLKLYLDARCVGESQTTPSNQTVSKPSKLLLGWRMQDYEMTEVRLWATARSADQLSDMRENYLGLAEAKRRMKIAIHQRNCTCEKCVSRRAQSAGAGAGGAPRLGYR